LWKIKAKNDLSYAFADRITSKIDTKMWGKDVKILKFEGQYNMGDPDDEYYLLATPKNIYLVRKIALSDRESVNSTAEKIFVKLEFL